MFVADVPLRVRYAETDQMGMVYYGNYATYFEVARVEALRSIGLTYAELEQQGIIMPVLDYYIKYFKPARYDDELNIRLRIPEMPSGPRIRFEYLTLRGQEELNQGYTTLVFVDARSQRPCPAPEDFKARLAAGGSF